MVITYQHLLELEACEKQLNLFEQAFGTSLELTTELEAQQELAQMLEDWKFDRNFAKLEILTEEQRIPYQNITGPYWEKFIDTIDEAWQKYLHTLRTEEDRYLLRAKATYETLHLNEERRYGVICWLIMIQILTGTLEQK